MPTISHDQNVMFALHFYFVDIMNAVELLMIPSASPEPVSVPVASYDQKVMLHLISIVGITLPIKSCCTTFQTK